MLLHHFYDSILALCKKQTAQYKSLAKKKAKTGSGSSEGLNRLRKNS
jgi:hypothetical protein